MESLTYYSPHTITALASVIAVATGYIFAKSKASSDGFVFTGFLIFSVVGILNTFFGYSATYDENSKLVDISEGVLLISTSSTLTIIGLILVAIGFLLRAKNAWQS